MSKKIILATGARGAGKSLKENFEGLLSMQHNAVLVRQLKEAG